MLRTKQRRGCGLTMSAAALIVLGACGTPSGGPSTTQLGEQGFESAQFVLIEYFGGLGSDEVDAIRHARCDSEDAQTTQLLREYRAFVRVNGLVRFKVASVDPAATAGDVPIEISIGDSVLTSVATLDGVAGGDICLSNIEPISLEGVVVPIWADS